MRNLTLQVPVGGIPIFRNLTIDSQPKGFGLDLSLLRNVFKVQPG